MEITASAGSVLGGNQHIKDNALEVRQNKTSKHLRILLKKEDGTNTELGDVIERIKARPRKVKSLHLLATPAGTPLNKPTLRIRFDKARDEAATKVLQEASDASRVDAEVLATRIRQFQFRDIRPKAASDIADLAAASALLGHTEQELTKKVYVRIGATVKPTR